MRFSTLLAATAALTLTLTASQALAWTDMYSGDTTGDPNQPPLVQAYPAANYCPAGKQPVTVGGVVYCGIPTAGTYYNPAPRPKPPARPAARSHLPRAYAPAGQ